MGEGLYEELAKLERGIGDEPTPVRIYAPVGSHKELLAYLVRRLLENGANSSFVNRIADDDIPVDDLVRDPVAELEKLEPKRNPAIPLPNAIFGKDRLNSAGVDLSDPLVREPLMKKLAKLEAKHWTRSANGQAARARSRRSFRRSIHRWSSARSTYASEADVDRMVRAGHAAQIDWDQLGGEERARLLDRAADLFEQHREELFSLCVREAGKTRARRRARSARGGRFPALLRQRGAAPVRQRHVRCPGRPAS